MNNRYLVVAIGCIECGAPSYPEALFDNLNDAEYHAEYLKHMREYEGHTEFYVWDIERMAVVAEV